MRVMLISPIVLDDPANAISNVSRQIIRQLDRSADARDEDLDMDVWSLLDASKSEAELAARFDLRRTRVRFRGFSGSRAAMLAAAALHRARHRLIVNMHIGQTPIARVVRGRGTRNYQFLHGVECWHKLPLRERLSLDAVDAFIANSRSTYERFLSCNPAYRKVPWAKCWLGLSSDFHIEKELDDQHSTSGADDASVLIVSRLASTERYKGHKQLLSAWPQVLERVPNAHLDIVGDGEDRSHLERCADAIGLRASGAVRFWGHLEGRALEERFRRCTVFAMPSTGEGFGLVYVEAMANGKPVVASCEDAAREVVQDGRTGLLVRQSDRAGLVDAICRLLQDKTLCRRMGALGRRRAHELFSEVAFGDRFCNALAELGATKAPHRYRELQQEQTRIP